MTVTFMSAITLRDQSCDTHFTGLEIEAWVLDFPHLLEVSSLLPFLVAPPQGLALRPGSLEAPGLSI